MSLPKDKTEKFSKLKLLEYKFSNLRFLEYKFSKLKFLEYKFSNQKLSEQCATQPGGEYRYYATEIRFR